MHRPSTPSLSMQRTPQRRSQTLRHTQEAGPAGLDREAYLPQEHPPGRQAQMDFIHCGELKVNAGRRRNNHLPFQFVLSHSGWRRGEATSGQHPLALEK